MDQPDKPIPTWAIILAVVIISTVLVLAVVGAAYFISATGVCG